jgi:hypothetical protein
VYFFWLHFLSPDKGFTNLSENLGGFFESKITITYWFYWLIQRASIGFMSQRGSGYARKALDHYETPEWVTHAVVPHLGTNLHVWEPPAGSGKMVRALANAGYTVEASDITEGRDFLQTPAILNCDAIVTNPPYSLAREFIEHAIEAIQPSRGKVAMLLRTDYHHAQGRQHLFGKCPIFAKKLVLTRRIKWFDNPGAAPSFNHAWYIWDWKHVGPPVLAYW